MRAYMIRLHMARRSLDQCSIGPRGVDAQSMARANWIWGGREDDIDSLVQSKKPMSWSFGGVCSLRKGSTSPALWALKTHSFVKEDRVPTDGLFGGKIWGATSPLLLPTLETLTSV
jgi:hypothetical protein